MTNGPEGTASSTQPWIERRASRKPGDIEPNIEPNIEPHEPDAPHPRAAHVGGLGAEFVLDPYEDPRLDLVALFLRLAERTGAMALAVEAARRLH